jgi:hypothetical protein
METPLDASLHADMSFTSVTLGHIVVDDVVQLSLCEASPPTFKSRSVQHCVQVRFRDFFR